MPLDLDQVGRAILMVQDIKNLVAGSKNQSKVSYRPKQSYDSERDRSYSGSSGSYSGSRSTSACSSANDEDECDYKKGGYHPVEIGDSFKDDRYIVLRKLGWGHYSTVWLCRDRITGDLVAMKIVKSESHYTAAALDEVKILEQLKAQKGHNQSNIVKLIDTFKHEGPNGKHVVIILEVLGSHLLQYIKDSNFRGMDLPAVKTICRQVLESLDFMHSRCSIIHTDLKPENILVLDFDKRTIQAKLTASQKRRKRKQNKNKEVEEAPSNLPPPSTTSMACTDPIFHEWNIKVTDFGNACWINRQFTNDIQTRQYRAPEVILGAPYSTHVDMWSFACIAFEIATGDLLFQPKSSEGFSKEDDHLAQIIELMGDFPVEVLSKGTKSNKYFSNGQLRVIGNLSYWPSEEVLIHKYHWSKPFALLFSSFINDMLDLNPLKRMSARQALEHPFISDSWACWEEDFEDFAHINRDEMSSSEDDEDSRDEYDHHHSRTPERGEHQ